MLPFVPATMMTQHPDSAAKYVSVQEEPGEAVEGLLPPPRGLGLEEIMIDFEGKLTPYHQPVQIALGLLQAGMTPGRDCFLTPRIPSASRETVFRQLMALLSIMETNIQTQSHSPECYPAVREVILPMCTSAEEIVQTKMRIMDILELAEKEFQVVAEKDLIAVIPLVEDVSALLGIKQLLREYLIQSRNAGFPVSYLRCMIGRSDPALSYGLVPAVLACKVALSRLAELEEEEGIPIYPIIGAGSLPFRGHISPANLANIWLEYPGLRTITIQSSLRYDYGPAETRSLARNIKAEIGRHRMRRYSAREYRRLASFTAVFAKHYLSSISLFGEIVCKISDLIPRQRDRLARTGTASYARELAHPKVLAAYVEEPELRLELQQLEIPRGLDLPRAITFTGAFYTLGFPPEFLGTGRALGELHARGGKEELAEFLSFYPSLKADLAYAGRFLNLNVARAFLSREACSLAEQDVNLCQELLGLETGPKTPDEQFYHILMQTAQPMLKHLIGEGNELVESVQQERQLVKNWIIRMGQIRGALG